MTDKKATPEPVPEPKKTARRKKDATARAKDVSLNALSRMRGRR